MKELDIFHSRMKKLGIDIYLVGNYPWIYLNEINGKTVKEKLSSEYGFVLGWMPVKYNDDKFSFNNLKEIFKLIRKYCYSSNEKP